MKSFETWKFHIRYETFSRFSASGNPAQIIDFCAVAQEAVRLHDRFTLLMTPIYILLGLSPPLLSDFFRHVVKLDSNIRRLSTFPATEVDLLDKI